MVRSLAHFIRSMSGDSRWEGCSELESQLALDPNDKETRKKLVECYWRLSVHSHEGSQKKRDRAAKQHADHVMWLIGFAPEDSFTGSPLAVLAWWKEDDATRIRNEWLTQVQKHPTEVAVLLNAAEALNFTAHREAERQEAEEIAGRAYSLDPQDPRACTTLASFLELKMQRAPSTEKTQLASRALQLREQGMASPREDRFEMLQAAAEDAFEAGDYSKAETYGNELLQLSRDSHWASQGAFHKGNLILGRLALKRGNLQEAKERLLLAGKLPESPVSMFEGFGPNMMLAKELLEKQQYEVVLRYFDECEQFWPEKTTLDVWREVVRGGGIPDFGGNLFY